MSDLFLNALALKDLERAGWRRVGLKQPESVAAHSWGVAWLVITHAPKHINTLRAIELALVHDVPEVVVGDITPHDGISRTEKHTRELCAAKQMFSEHPHLFDAWREYAEAETPEAAFVKECDRLDMALQAIRYRRELDINTDEFIHSAKKHLRTPALLRALADALQEPSNDT